MEASHHENEGTEPGAGDLIIDSTDQGHSVQLLPYCGQIQFRMFETALKYANRWTVLHSGAIWNRVDGKIVKLQDRGRVLQSEEG